LDLTASPIAPARRRGRRQAQSPPVSSTSSQTESDGDPYRDVKSSRLSLELVKIFHLLPEEKQVEEIARLRTKLPGIRAALRAPEPEGDQSDEGVENLGNVD
jgi:hypothetical protein